MAVILLLALFTLPLVMGIGTTTSGWTEKLALLGLVAVCASLAAQVSLLASRVQKSL